MWTPHVASLTFLAKDPDHPVKKLPVQRVLQEPVARVWGFARHARARRWSRPRFALTPAVGVFWRSLGWAPRMTLHLAVGAIVHPLGVASTFVGIVGRYALLTVEMAVNLFVGGVAGLDACLAWRATVAHAANGAPAAQAFAAVQAAHAGHAGHGAASPGGAEPVLDASPQGRSRGGPVLDASSQGRMGGLTGAMKGLAVVVPVAHCDETPYEAQERGGGPAGMALVPFVDYLEDRPARVFPEFRLRRTLDYPLRRDVFAEWGFDPREGPEFGGPRWELAEMDWRDRLVTWRQAMFDWIMASNQLNAGPGGAPEGAPAGGPEGGATPSWAGTVRGWVGRWLPDLGRLRFPRGLAATVAAAEPLASQEVLDAAAQASAPLPDAASTGAWAWSPWASVWHALTWGGRGVARGAHAVGSWLQGGVRGAWSAVGGAVRAVGGWVGGWVGRLVQGSAQPSFAEAVALGAGGHVARDLAARIAALEAQPSRAEAVALAAGEHVARNVAAFLLEV